ncbi:restriction endonuclease subunit S [Microcystis aeruginosa]|uniref:restriction endonuclease subunit S n=1 Tax=Microcystis aeruginosa TaxID=1126 RepID=UPI00232D8C6A|nr:restriction endonuclease subunit S [Microcystis aeruginosa]
MTKKWQPYPTYKDSGVEWLGAIPEHWEVKKCKQLSLIKRGASPRPIDDPSFFDDDGAYSWVRISDVTASNKYLETSEQKLSELGKSKSIALEPGELFVSICATVGKPIITNIKCCIHDGFVYFPFLKENREYLFYIFSGGELYKGVGKQGTQLNLNTDIIGDIKLPIPPLPEQQKIAEFLDQETSKIDKLITKKERLIELLKEKRTALISHAVTKGLNPDVPMKDSGVEWLGEIPEHWEVKRLKFLITESLKYGANESAQLEDKDCPRFIRITDITEDGLLKEDTFRSLPKDIAKPFILKTGDILFARSGATFGKSFMYREQWGIACHAGYLIRARLKLAEALPEFVSYFANSSVYWDWISSIFIQATIQNVSAEKYANLWMGVPDIQEQQKIAQFLDRETSKIDNLITKTRTSIDHLKEYRTALISAAVTGKIDVREH